MWTGNDALWLKEHSHEIFSPQYFRLTNPSVPLIDRLKHFRIWLRFHNFDLAVSMAHLTLDIQLLIDIFIASLMYFFYFSLFLCLE